MGKITFMFSHREQIRLKTEYRFRLYGIYSQRCAKYEREYCNPKFPVIPCLQKQSYLIENNIKTNSEKENKNGFKPG